MKSKVEKMALKIAKEYYKDYKILSVMDEFAYADLTLLKKDHSGTIIVRVQPSKEYKDYYTHTIL